MRKLFKKRPNEFWAKTLFNVGVFFTFLGLLTALQGDWALTATMVTAGYACTLTGLLYQPGRARRWPNV